MARPRLGDVLKQAGVVTDTDLERAIREQKDRSMLLGEVLLQKGLVPKDTLASALQEVTRIPYLDCQAVVAETAALELMSRELALRYCCLPVALRERELVLVMAEPQNLRSLDELRFITGQKISPRLGFQAEIKAAISKYYPDASSPAEEAEQEALPAGLEGGIPDMEFFTASSRQRAREAIKEFQAALRSKPTAAVRLVSNVIYAAESKKASDIHIDPQATDTVIRMRVDGILRDIMQVSQGLASHLVSRIKILADLDIAERRAPQDGRFLVRIGQRKLDLRVSTLPTHYGEKVVMRLLSPDSTSISFVNLGFSEEHSRVLSRTLGLPQGLVLVCGPTGSGKTTTLYAALHQLSTRSVNIITVEDPIEYMLEGINQVQVNSKAGLTFAGCLRSILRQDPNIVMVGEIRDKETAEIALTAAQTGHLVLSTLHTNDSVAALDRLRDLNVPAFLISSSVTAIVSQRLLRKLCSCRVEAQPSAFIEVLPEVGGADFAGHIFAPGGCEACDNTGYKGRIAVCEVLSINDEIRRLIQREVGSGEIRTLAAGSGVRFMREEALEKVKSGLTSVDEVLRVVPMQERPALPCHHCSKDLLATFTFCPYCGIQRGEMGAVTRPLGAVPGGVRE
jgi:type IV pilus assembly protein PilB